jgi:hypothetical protein
MEKSDLLKLLQQWGEGRITENGTGGKFKYDMIRTFLNATVYPSTIIKKKSVFRFSRVLKINFYKLILLFFYGHDFLLFL